ncbi:YncE family protein [Halobacillus sp. ACCC02827]|uniref:YncE family protein n=1 Tax=Halobacillus sp. ACCC02827 TaxID=3052090 RepID=UPI002570F2E4|nr:YncE family protein [Halobacillus sp. ACCC02827]WJE16230.1 YncE family protein [Halobacillus sp. ACCC02827]
MNKCWMFLLLVLLLLLSGCREDKVVIPQGAADSIVISHLKDNRMSFLDPEGNLLKDTKVGTVIADMERIDDLHIAFTTKKEDFLVLLNLETGKTKNWADVGPDVNKLLYDADSHQLYLADSKNNQVQVFDTEKEAITGMIPVGSFPLSMVTDDHGEMLYVLNQQDDSVSVIDTKTFEVVREIAVPHLPEGLWYNDSKLYIGGHGPVHGELNRHVYVFDVDKGEQMDRIAVGLMPVNLYSPEGSSNLYVVCHGSHEVVKVPFDDYENKETVKVGANPFDVISQHGNLYVSSIDSDKVTVMDIESFEVTREIAVDGGPVTMIAGGKEE